MRTPTARDLKTADLFRRASKGFRAIAKRQAAARRRRKALKEA